MKRYLGIKIKVLPAIKKEIDLLLSGEKGTVCDIFAGTLSVSFFLKQEGHKVISNDVNLFSYVYGKAFLQAKRIPQFNLNLLLRGHMNDMSKINKNAIKILDTQKEIFDKNNVHKEFKDWGDYCDKHLSLACVLAFLSNCPKPIKKKGVMRKDIFDHYAQDGEKSKYISLRGTKGKRNFFTSQNAKKIDIILSYIRFWYRNGLITEDEKCLLLSILIGSMEKHVNIQGTYHDFPRSNFEPRALKPFEFLFPDYSGLLYNQKEHTIGKGEDSLEFIEKVEKHDILYIDPPYNFRQYTAYYFLPNFIAAYADIEDLDEYLSNIEFVRGQNMASDFNSTFCKKDTFIRDLERLIRKAKCKHVVMSYFNGVNHWNKFLEKDNEIGLNILNKFFKGSDIFEKDSFKSVPVDRKNYQSQNGHKSRVIQEYLLVAKKK